MLGSNRKLGTHVSAAQSANELLRLGHCTEFLLPAETRTLGQQRSWPFLTLNSKCFLRRINFFHLHTLLKATALEAMKKKISLMALNNTPASLTKREFQTQEGEGAGPEGSH